MNHFILIHSNDSTRWNFSKYPSGVVISESGMIKDLPSNPAQLEKADKIIVFPPTSRVLDNVYWENSREVLPKFWLHLGGRQTIYFSKAEIMKYWNLEFEGVNFPWTKRPLPYSMGTRTRPWDKVIQGLAKYVRNEASWDDSTVSQLDMYGKQAEVDFYGFQGVETLLSLIFPLYLNLATLSDLAGIDETLRSDCEKAIRAFGNCKEAALQRADEVTKSVDVIFQEYFPLLTKEVGEEQLSESMVGEALELFKELLEDPGKGICYPSNYTRGLKPLFQILNLRS